MKGGSSEYVFPRTNKDGDEFICSEEYQSG